MTGTMTEQGVKFDAAKLPLDLIPDEALAALAEVLRFGAQKYAPRNWEKGLSSARVLAAAERHFMARRAGQVNDPETGKPHLAHAFCEVMFALVFDLRGQSDLPLEPRHAGHVAVLKALEAQAPRGDESHQALTEVAIPAPARIREFRVRDLVEVRPPALRTLMAKGEWRIIESAGRPENVGKQGEIMLNPNRLTDRIAVGGWYADLDDLIIRVSP